MSTIQPESILKVIWIDPNINNKENTLYYNELFNIIKNNCNEYNKFTFEKFKNISDGMKYIKQLKFETTIIIISGNYYKKFIFEFIKNMNNIYIIPKIIIFTRYGYTLNNDDEISKLINSCFFNYGGININIEEIKKFILKQIQKKDIFNSNKNINNICPTFSIIDDLFVFEYIDSKEKLILPLTYKALIEETINNNDNVKLIKYLYNNYNELYHILNSIISISDIPIELLSKFYARIYTYESNFYKNLNRDLINNNNEIIY